jgi:hypothetical protein
MLVSVGMYLPFGTTFAISSAAHPLARRHHREEEGLQRGADGALGTSSVGRVGPDRGEALMGLVTSGFAICDVQVATLSRRRKDSRRTAATILPI